MEATPIDSAVVDLVRRHGPLPFSQVMDLALYDPEHGFYAAGGAAGRRGDFITSPEVGPLFGAVVARALDEWWEELGKPDPFTVVEAGAGVGTLAIAILAASPRCARALRYVLVERSASLRDQQGRHLELADPATALGAAGGGGRVGPVVTSLAELPVGPFVGIVLANELLDNLALDLLVRTAEGWGEVRVGVDDPASPSPGVVRQVVAATEPAAAVGERLAPGAAVGAIVPWQRAAGEWVARAVGLVERGRVVVFDYATLTTAELVDRPDAGWLRVYRDHERLGDPLVALGTADITADVAIDQLDAAIGTPATVRTQAEWLRAFGIDELVDEGRRTWEAGAATGDLAALKARSRVSEAEALVDPAGLGAFLVAEWTA